MFNSLCQVLFFVLQINSFFLDVSGTEVMGRKALTKTCWRGGALEYVKVGKQAADTGGNK